MVKIFYITSIELQELTPYRTLRQTLERFKEGLFIAEGEKVVQRLLDSDLEIVSVLITPEWYEKHNKQIESRPEEIKVFIALKELLEDIVGFNLHQGIMALAKTPKPADISLVLTRTSSPHLLVAIDGLTNSENTGVLIRNCAAFGVHAVLVGEKSSSPYLRRAVRNSMGAVFKLPIIHCENLAETLMLVGKEYNCKIIAAHPHAEGGNIGKSDFSGNCCIVFGSEGNGISPETLSICNLQVVIPMQSEVDSLNVASASAVFLYEVVRQRKTG